MVYPSHLMIPAMVTEILHAHHPGHAGGGGGLERRRCEQRDGGGDDDGGEPEAVLAALARPPLGAAHQHQDGAAHTDGERKITTG